MQIVEGGLSLAKCLVFVDKLCFPGGENVSANELMIDELDLTGDKSDSGALAPEQKLRRKFFISLHSDHPDTQRHTLSLSSSRALSDRR